MRVLLIAYEWPPITAAQSLRWYYLANGLAELGVSVHVLCPRVRADTPFPGQIHPNVQEHRVWPGPFIGIPQSLAYRASASNNASPEARFERKPSLLASSKLRGAYIRIRRVLDHLIFPDVRSEWYPFARPALLRLLEQHKFDAIVSSHEPGVDLLLGLLAQRKTKLPWLVDLADPLLAPYTPKWRRWLDHWFEGLVLRRSTKIILTTHKLIDVLVSRHAEVGEAKFSVVSQGGAFYDSADSRAQKSRHSLHLVFTGNFYHGFRDPLELVKSLRILNNKGIKLTIAGNNAAFVPLFDGIDNVEFLGPISHFQALNLQQEADLLLNIGNGQSDQLPGKIFEYLVSGRPILHIRGSSDDPTEPYLADHSCAFVSDNKAESIQEVLKRIISLHESKALCTTQESTRILREMHGWSARASALKEVIDRAITGGRLG